MAIESVTKMVEFNHAPAFPCGLFQVNAGVDVMHSLGTAECIQSFVQTRLKNAVDNGMDSEEVYVHSILVEMVAALYKASGAEA